MQMLTTMKAMPSSELRTVAGGGDAPDDFDEIMKSLFECGVAVFKSNKGLTVWECAQAVYEVATQDQIIEVGDGTRYIADELGIPHQIFLDGGNLDLNFFLFGGGDPYMTSNLDCSGGGGGCNCFG